MMGREGEEEEATEERKEDRHGIQRPTSADAGSFLTNLPSRIPSLTTPPASSNAYIQGRLHSPKGIPINSVAPPPPNILPPNPVMAELCGSKRGEPSHSITTTAAILTTPRDAQRVGEEAVPEAARPTSRPRLWTDSE